VNIFKSTLRACVICTFLVFSGQTVAHPSGHGETEIDAAAIGKLADSTLPKLIEGKKVKAEWAQSSRDSVKRDEVSGKNVWVVTYKRASADQKLYFFFDDLGNLLDANHTGELAKKN
jgi:hypothetical protein